MYGVVMTVTMLYLSPGRDLCKVGGGMVVAVVDCRVARFIVMVGWATIISPVVALLQGVPSARAPGVG